MGERLGRKVCDTLQVCTFCIISKKVNLFIYSSYFIQDSGIVLPFGTTGFMVHPPFCRPIIMIIVWDVICLLWTHYEDGLLREDDIQKQEKIPWLYVDGQVIMMEPNLISRRVLCKRVITTMIRMGLVEQTNVYKYIYIYIYSFFLLDFQIKYNRFTLI